MNATAAKSTKPVAIWLFVVAAMIFAMVIIGGLTRLTDSGLSMVSWKPFTGWLPPLSEAAWQALFDDYKRFPQFQQLFPNLTLDGFKDIFWFEYIHRVFGRVIGLVFLVPFLWFLVTRRLSLRMAVPLAIVFVLGAAQGALGWWMVQSGLVSEPSVSQYRLAAHLALAIALYAYVLWFALGVLQRRGEAQVGGGLRAGAWLVAALTVVTIVSGAFVAGLDAGKLYNEFPFMGKGLIPEDYAAGKPFWQNAFENPAAVQFHHRVLAVVTAVAIVLLWLACLFGRIHSVTRGAAHVLLLALVLQWFIGIEMLLNLVPVWLGALHQAGAMVLLTAFVWFLHNMYGHRIERAQSMRLATR